MRIWCEIDDLRVLLYGARPNGNHSGIDWIFRTPFEEDELIFEHGVGHGVIILVSTSIRGGT